MARFLKHLPFDGGRWLWYAGLVAATLLTTACPDPSARQVREAPAGGGAGYLTLDERFEPLRTAFNAASEDVRGVLLAAPT